MTERKRLLRALVLDILFRRETGSYPPNQLANLKTNAEALERKTPAPKVFSPFPQQPRLDYDDDLLVQEIFWDLVIERVVTIGMDASNADLPWFRLHSEAAENSSRASE
jgi:hypothetical protein